MLAWLRSYRPEWLRPDLLAGLITAAVVIPKAMAYATVAGLPVQVGLYTAFVPMVIYAVLGSSQVLSVSTTTTIAILTGAALAEVSPDGNMAVIVPALATLTLLVGLLLALASVLRLGFLANFISEPVLIGFKAGIGLVIMVDQMPKLFGLGAGIAAMGIAVTTPAIGLRVADHAGAGAGHQPDAPVHAGGRGDHLFGGSHPARRVPRHPRRAAQRVHLVTGGAGGSCHAGYSPGHPRRHHRVGGGARPAGFESTGLPARAQAWHQCPPAAVAEYRPNKAHARQPSPAGTSAVCAR